MTRKTIILKIEDTKHPSNRDIGKVFVITEMAAVQATEWADRLLLIISRTGMDLPAAKNRGMAGLVEIGFRMLPMTTYPEMQPILSELLKCVKIRPNKDNPDIERDLIMSDIEEIPTVYRLRQEAFMVHAGFFLEGLPSIPESAKLDPTTSNIPTSTPPLVRPSRQARRALRK
jgi:hypothetical protein